MPDASLQKRHEDSVQEELASLRIRLGAEEIEELKTEQASLKAFQGTPDSPSAVRTLPELRLSDIPPKVEVPIISWTTEGPLLLGGPPGVYQRSSLP